VEFAALWGVSDRTVSSWLKRYAEEGPKGLEDRTKAGPGRPRKIPPAVREEIAHGSRSLEASRAKPSHD